ncbi:MAG: zf-HC2 domain-containing protein, partial [Deltaproteobacteria bacterium]|nr:zf-HC2 domain-containing protein [Deltaproteobacteria bacterium]
MKRVTCQQVEGILPEFAEGTLDEPQRAAVAVHLAVCESCREAELLLAEITTTVRTAELEPLPELVERR